MTSAILIEGLTPDEIARIPVEHIEQLVFTGAPVVFQAGSAEILGEFKIIDSRLVLELAHIDGGGEGVLSALWLLAEKMAAQRGLQKVEWIVYAVDCAKPNLKLRRLLERRGFSIENVPEKGNAYYYLHHLTNK